MAPARPSSRHLRGFVLLTGGQASARAATFMATAYLARSLGLEMFGVVVLASVVATIFSQVVVEAGQDLVGMREIAQEPSSVETIVASILTTRLVLAAGAGLLLWVIVPWLTPSPAGLTIMLAYGLTFFSFASNLKWSFQALGQNGLVAAMLVLSQMVYLGGVLVSVKEPSDALKVPLLLFGSELVAAGILCAAYRRQGFRLRFPRSPHFSWILLRAALPIASTRALRAITINFDLVLLALVGTPQTVAVYGAASRIIVLLRELGELYYLPMLPELSRAAKESAERCATVARAGLPYAAVIIFPLALGGSLRGPELLSFVFGPEYASGAGALGLLLAAMVFLMLSGAYRMSLVASGRQGTLFRITAMGTALNIGMNVVLIPRFSMVGGALSALASEALILVVAWLAVAPSVSLSPWRALIRPALAAVGMAGVLWLLSAEPFLVTVGIGAASYTVLVFLVGAVRPGELREAWHARSLSSPPGEGD